MCACFSADKAASDRLASMPLVAAMDVLPLKEGHTGPGAAPMRSCVAFFRLQRERDLMMRARVSGIAPAASSLFRPGRERP